MIVLLPLHVYLHYVSGVRDKAITRTRWQLKPLHYLPRFWSAFTTQNNIRRRRGSNIIICTVGITLALFGVILTYHSSKGVLGEIGHTLNWTGPLTATDRFEPHLIKLAFLFILIEYGTKAGLAPMHTWPGCA